MDYKNIELSIIIPVYNMEQYLRRCLNSVIKAVENLQDTVEVLIINDGSKDSSPKIIKEYCEKYSYMKQYDKVNGGLSDVKNYGLERAKGNYVIFLDSDDYVEPKMYAVMLAELKKEKADVVVCDIELVYDEPEKNVVCPCNIVSRDEAFDQIIDMNMMPASWNKIVKRELYEGLTFPVGKNNEDVAVTPIVLGRAKKIAVVNRPFYKYYQRSGSIQNSVFDERRFVILETSKICVERIKELNETKQDKIKGSVYLHQVLSLALYLIRREKLKNRYIMLKKYMSRVEKELPDIWDNFEIKEFLTWDGKLIQIYRRISVFLMKNKLYLLLSLFWSMCNIVLLLIKKEN